MKKKLLITVDTAKIHNLEWSPNRLTAISDNQPPAKTPKLPPNIEQAVSHNPGL